MNTIFNATFHSEHLRLYYSDNTHSDHYYYVILFVLGSIFFFFEIISISAIKI